MFPPAWSPPVCWRRDCWPPARRRRCAAAGRRAGLPALPGRQHLACRRQRPAGASPLGGLDRLDGRARAAPPSGLRAQRRRAALRDPLLGGAGLDAEGGGHLRLRRRERPRALPVRAGHADRGRLRRPRPRRRQGPLRALRALRRRLERRAAHRRVGGDLGSAQQRPAAERAGRRPTPPACLSCPGCCDGTRWRPARSTMPSASPLPAPTAASCGPPATRPARPATLRSRRWGRGSGSRPVSTSPATGPTHRWCCGPCSATA